MAERTTPGARVALTIAGSDSCGGAGIQADLKTFAVMEVYGASALTAVTAQNTTGVRRSFLLEPELVEQQIDAVAGDLQVSAAKTGMLGSAAIIETVARAVKRHNLAPLVVDPVMVSKRGDSLIDDAAVAALGKRLLPLAAVVTPNRHEAARLLGRRQPIGDLYAAVAAAREICLRHGARACLLKGIRRPDEHEGEAVDLYAFVNAQGRLETRELVGQWRPTQNTHGSGCTFSAAITAALAHGRPLDEALDLAKHLISEAIRQATSLGHGTGPVNHLAWLKVKQ